MIEIPSYFFILFTVDHLGRKPMLVYGLLLTGVGCLSAAFMENEVVQTTLSLIGKLCSRVLLQSTKMDGRITLLF